MSLVHHCPKETDNDDISERIKERNLQEKSHTMMMAPLNLSLPRIMMVQQILEPIIASSWRVKHTSAMVKSTGSDA